MKYLIDLDGKIASVEIDKDMNVNDLILVQELLNKTIENRKKEIGGFRCIKLDKIEPPLSVRAYNCLKRAGYNTVGDVLDSSIDEIKNIRNLGLRCSKEVINRFSEYGTFKEFVCKEEVVDDFFVEESDIDDLVFDDTFDE